MSADSCNRYGEAVAFDPARLPLEEAAAKRSQPPWSVHCRQQPGRNR